VVAEVKEKDTEANCHGTETPSSVPPIPAKSLLDKENVASQSFSSSSSSNLSSGKKRKPVDSVSKSQKKRNKGTPSPVTISMGQGKNTKGSASKKSNALQKIPPGDQENRDNSRQKGRAKAVENDELEFDDSGAGCQRKSKIRKTAPKKNPRSTAGIVSKKNKMRR